MRDETVIPAAFAPIGDADSLKKQVFSLCESMHQQWDVVMRMPISWRWSLLEQKKELEELKAQYHKEAMSRAKSRRRRR